MNPRLQALSAAGVSIWLDDLSRDRLLTKNLQHLVDNFSVVGVTTNPAIFAASVSAGSAYDDMIAPYAERGASPAEAVFGLTTADVRDACEVLLPVFDNTQGRDGRVSIEVAPELAHDTAATIAQAKELAAAVGQPNVMIKIPATDAGANAITAVLGEGLSVNVTLIFGITRYQQVMNAFTEGLELALRNGHDLSQIHSVASFFVSRLDTEIDARLEKIGSDQALALRGMAGVANARLALAEFDRFFDHERWQSLLAAGAHHQRPLWASTGVKNSSYSDTMYVANLIAPHTVNTMPEKTLLAFADHGDVAADTIRPNYAHAQDLLSQLAEVGIGYDDVIATLERQGVEKFVASWSDLLNTVSQKLSGATL
jgi:transaldolase